MVYIITSLFDEKSRQYMAPQLDTNEQTAIRNFRFALSSNDSLNFSSADLRLYQLGEFDSESGSIDVLAVPQLIIDGKEFGDEA